MADAALSTNASQTAKLLSTRSSERNRRHVAWWLLACCALLFAMVVVGGITRLTHSGLSITEWQPIVGTIPPLSAADWEEAFSKYRATPEYLKKNRGMSLQAFKGIFWWEYLHRLLGRLIGLVFLLPFLYFAFSKRIERALVPQLVGLFILGALQGALGWYMVQSGLVDNPRVSHYRLTAHLGLAALIYAWMLWIALGLLQQRSFPAALAKLRGYAWALTLLIFVMILSGGLVAGMRAGHAYNTFPLMGGRFFPPEMFALEPWYMNFFINMATVQFDHRLLAWLLAFIVPAFWFVTRRAALSARARLALSCLPLMLALQIALGIGTLLQVVPVPLAAAHQAGALLTLSAALWVAHELS